MKTKLHSFIFLVCMSLNFINQDTFAQDFITLPPNGIGEFNPTTDIFYAIASPYRSSQRNNHFQTIFTKDELILGGAPNTSGCQVSSIGFNIFQVINADFYNSGSGLVNYTIKLRNISIDTTVIGDVFIPIDDTYIVKNPFNINSTVIGTTGFNDFTLDIPFDWDGIGNILVDVCYGENSGTASGGAVRGLVRFHPWEYLHTGCSKTLMSSESNVNVCDNLGNIILTSNLKPVTRFGFVPTNNDPPCDFLVSPSSPVICVGESVVLSANNGAENYSWSPNTGLSTTNESVVIASPAETTTYTITGTTGECESIQTVTITVNPVSELIVTQNPENAFLCSGLISLSISSSFSNIEWSNGINDNTEIEITAPGTYSVTATNEFNCVSNSQEIIIEQGITPEVSVSPSESLFLCNGNVTLIANTGLNNYVWSNAETGNSIEVSEAGEYYVSAQNTEGCTGQSAIVVVNPSYEVEVEITSPITSICAGNPVTISTEQTFSNYEWSNGGSSNSISVTQSGNYSLTVTDDNGCSGTSEIISIEIVEFPVAGFTYEQNMGYTIDFNNTSSDGITFLWDFGGGNSSSQENPSFTYPFDGSYPVTLIVSNDCGSDTLFVTIEVLKLSTGLNPETSNWSVFPNPFSDFLNIQPNKIVKENIVIHVLNILGQNVYKGEYRLGKQDLLNIPVQHLSSGVYFVRLETINELSTYKIIKH